jgi:glutathione S-transferase
VKPRLYDLLDSPFCLKVRICLALKGIPYERIGLTLFRLSELRRLNPLAKVPVLVADEDAIADSSRIVRFLDERHPHRPLVPRDASARAYAHLLEDWADESLSSIVGACKWLDPANRARAYERTAELVPAFLPRRPTLALVRLRITGRFRASGYDRRSVPHLEERMAENLAALADLLADKPFLLGRYVTVADVAVFAQLHWLSRYAQRRLLDDVPVVRSWMTQLEEVPEVQQAIRVESPAENDEPAAAAG